MPTDARSPRQDPRKVQRRSRLPLSCEPCRFRKLKCNREKPCQNCAARSEQAGCQYRGHANGTSLASNGSQRESNGPKSDALRQRLDHLEGLVKRLINEPSHPMVQSRDLKNGVGIFTPETSPQDGTTSGAPSAVVGGESMLPGIAGKTVIDGVHSVYLGADDWSAVLQEINDLKKTWAPEQVDDNDNFDGPTLSHTVDGSSLLFEEVKPLEKISILSTLPPKPQLDWLIAQFFDTQNFQIVLPPILHEPTFMREYEEHCKDPSKTNFIWLGLLFSILSITMLSFHQYGEPSQYEGLSESLFQLYRIRTAQCLLSGDIAKCQPYTIETLRFNATAEHNRKDDSRRGLWIMTGVLVRAAVNMGYHRDPSQSSGFSVVQAEYRRRVWSAVTCIDDMASFLGGFPRTMSSLYSDTHEPRNLHEWELNEGMTSLPPSRPLNEKTPVTYLIVKTRLFRELGRIVDYNCNPNQGPYEIVIDIDNALKQAYENFPSYMKVSLTTGSSEQIITPQEGCREGNLSNISLVTMYHRSLCTLHRKFLARNRQDGRFNFSRERCISSALALLKIQEHLSPAFYKTSQTRQMVMLGAMILFQELALRKDDSEEREVVGPDSSILFQALEKSCELFAEAVSNSEDAKKVHHFLSNMLASFRSGGGSRPDSQAATEALKQLSPRQDFDAPFGASNGAFPFDDGWTGVDFDWDSWKSFIDETSYEAGQV